jgi:flagellar export protein FliJ
MKQFRFTLEAVLTLRKMEQEKALEAYAESVSRCLQLRTAVLSAHRRQADLARLLDATRENLFSSAIQEAYLQSMEVARQQAEQLQKNLDTAENEKESRRQFFLSAKRRVDILLNLKDKKKQTYLRETQRNEEKAVEDLVIASHQKSPIMIG